MNLSTNYAAYASKMRGMATDGVDLEADARFVDMLLGRRGHVLDIGCGIGTAVKALRQRGHEAYGIDPSPEVLTVARELFDPAWYRRLDADQLAPSTLDELDMPTGYDCLLMSGNVAAFLMPATLRDVFHRAGTLLAPAGHLVIGTSTNSPGGPNDQDRAAVTSGLILQHRFSDWHLQPFDEDPWSVSVFTTPGRRAATDGPDGMFLLPV